MEARTAGPERIWRLRPHPRDLDPIASAVFVEAWTTSPGRLALRYRVEAEAGSVRLPRSADTRRTDGLWRTTCFEAFVGRGAAGYAEFNLSPSSEWAAYAFTGYREGRTDLDTTSPEIVLHRTRDRFDVKGVVTLPDDATGPIGLSAVIESTDGLTSYWALAHPSDKPDFHHPDSFTLVLPAAEQT